MRLCGVIVVLVALWFVGSKIYDNLSYLAEFNVDTSLVLNIVVWAIFYALVSFALSLAWFILLNQFGGSSLNIWACHKIYARSQLAKYIPGNVFHLGSRHALGAVAGLNHSTLFAAAFFEAAGIVISASLITFASLTINPINLWGYSPDYYLLGLVLTCIAPFVLFFVVTRIGIFKRIQFLDVKLTAMVRRLFPAFVCYLVFLILSGLIILWMDCYVRGFNGLQGWLVIVVVYAISWVAGFVTPGASAGIGVREAIMVAWLGGVVGEGHALFIALIFRIVTVLGDVLFFSSSFIVGKRGGVF